MDEQSDLFFRLHDGLPRQAPGSEATTLRLLDLVGPLPPAPEVLDIGCGPGRATLVLAQALPRARVTAVDLFQPFLEDLSSAATTRGLDSRVYALRAAMEDLPFGDGAFDLLWSEGAIYLMGFDVGLRSWRRLVRPEGAVVVTEATWFTDTPSGDALAFWAEAYPAMTDVATNRRLAEDAGYQVVATYRLPRRDWWDEYYTPLAARFESFAALSAAAAAVVASERQEVELHRRHGDEYGYTGFVLRPVTPASADPPTVAPGP